MKSIAVTLQRTYHKKLQKEALSNIQPSSLTFLIRLSLIVKALTEGKLKELDSAKITPSLWVRLEGFVKLAVTLESRKCGTCIR